MLDILELLGFDFDGLDSGHSTRWQQRIFPNSQPCSICAEMVRRKWWIAVILIGFFHCRRSYDRYY